jgi:hypothetical protein
LYISFYFPYIFSSNIYSYKITIHGGNTIFQKWEIKQPLLGKESFKIGTSTINKYYFLLHKSHKPTIKL